MDAIDKKIAQAEKWFSDNDITHPLYEKAFLKLRKLLMYKAGLRGVIPIKLDKSIKYENINDVL